MISADGARVLVSASTAEVEIRNQLASAKGKGGKLEPLGLGPFSGADAEAAARQAADLKPLDPSTLK